MAAISDYLEAAVLNYVFNNDTDSLVSAVPTYVALFTATATDAGGGTECAATSYSRVAIYPSTAVTATPEWSAPAATSSPAGAQQISNAGTVTFPTAVDAFGDIKGMGLYNHASTGDLLWHGLLAVTKTVGVGDTFKFTTGNLKLTLA